VICRSCGKAFALEQFSDRIDDIIEKMLARIRRTNPLKKKNKAMDDFKLLIDLHKQGHRQGPGGDAETEKRLSI
jgi:hypothetical protein